MDVHYGSTINTLVWNNSLTHSNTNSTQMTKGKDRREREAQCKSEYLLKYTHTYIHTHIHCILPLCLSAICIFA